MKKQKVPVICFILITWAIASTGVAQQPVFPVKISENGRYITDRNNNPVSGWHNTMADFPDYTLDEARLILEKSKSNGFILFRRC